MSSKQIVPSKSNLPAHWTEHASQLPIRFEYKNTKTIAVDANQLNENRIVANMEPSDYTNAYKILRTQLLHTLRDNEWSTVAVTSPGINDGKTLTAINLAISMAMDINNTVLLVDANLRNPSIHKYFGLGQKQGLSDFLTENIPLENLLVHPEGIDRFVVLPGGSPLVNAGEMLSSYMMIRFVKEVRERYSSRIIIFDLPSVMVAGEALAITPYIDTVILVAEAGKTKKQDLVHTETLLASSNVIGTVLTKSRDHPRNP